MQCIELTFGIHQKICPNVTWSTSIFSETNLTNSPYHFTISSCGGFPGGPVMTAPHFSTGSVGLISGRETKMPQAWPKTFKKITKLKKKKKKLCELKHCMRVILPMWKLKLVISTSQDICKVNRVKLLAQDWHLSKKIQPPPPPAPNVLIIPSFWPGALQIHDLQKETLRQFSLSQKAPSPKTCLPWDHLPSHNASQDILKLDFLLITRVGVPQGH